ncbi:MAG: hypothetical protein ACK5QU_12495 [Bacteroidota bacterium]
MKQIQSMINSEVKGFNFDEKTGAIEIELENEIGATDFLQMKLAAIYVDSYSIDHDTANMDFAIKKFNYLFEVFSFLNKEVIAQVRLMTEVEIKNPDENWSDSHSCFFRNKRAFKQRLVITFDVPDLQQKENECCYVSLTMDIVESNYEFYI